MDKEILSIVLSCLLLFPLVISIIFSLCIASKEQKENKKLKNEKLSLEIKNVVYHTHFVDCKKTKK